MKLKFKHQPFQAEAAAAVCDVFNDQPLRTANYRIDLGDTTNMQQRMDFSEVGFRNHPLVPELTRSRILENLRAVQIRNNLKPSDALAGPGINLTIEMETGTGKTYTYVKTMYELNRRYGWSKFIIVVPSVAIREGVAKSLETTQQHFSDEYGKKIRFFTYSSDKLTEVDNFASDSGIYAMIINMQAFNSSKNQKIIDKKLDSFRSRRPIDIIAQTNPILIIDEPQSVEGKQTKESLKKFNALFTLRYSATHKEKYDMVYRLDAMDAYNQHLVKKIAALGITLTGTTATNSFVYVEGVDIYKNKAPTARLGFEIKGKTGTRTMVRLRQCAQYRNLLLQLRYFGIFPGDGLRLFPVCLSYCIQLLLQGSHFGYFLRQQTTNQRLSRVLNRTGLLFLILKTIFQRFPERSYELLIEAKFFQLGYIIGIEDILVLSLLPLFQPQQSKDCAGKGGHFRILSHKNKNLKDLICLVDDGLRQNPARSSLQSVITVRQSFPDRFITHKGRPAEHGGVLVISDGKVLRNGPAEHHVQF